MILIYFSFLFFQYYRILSFIIYFSYFLSLLLFFLKISLFHRRRIHFLPQIQYHHHNLIKYLSYLYNFTFSINSAFQYPYQNILQLYKQFIYLYLIFNLIINYFLIGWAINYYLLFYYHFWLIIKFWCLFLIIIFIFI